MARRRLLGNLVAGLVFAVPATAGESPAVDHGRECTPSPEVTELASETPAHAVDGCGVPVWILSVAAMAHAWAHLSWSMADPDRDPLLARIGAAMQEHPWHVSGDERIDLRLARAAAERYVGKIGAKGVFCIALPDREISIALKVESGDDAAVAVAARHVIDVVAPGALHPDPDFPWHHVKNVVGDTVGARHVLSLIHI